MLFLLYGFRSLFDHLKCSGHFVPNTGKICAQKGPLGINDNIRRNCRGKATEPYRLAQAALHPVALYGPSQHPAHGKTDAKSWRGFFVQAALQIKNCHVRRKVTASLFVNPFEIRMAQKPPQLGKLALRLLRNGQSRSRASRLRLYSRNPGFTATRLRPLARRREMTARPLLVFIRVRKPCVFER